MKKEIIIPLIALLILAVGIAVGLALCPEKKAPAPEVSVFPSPTSGISPLEITISVKINSQIELKSISVSIDEKEIFSKDISGDFSETITNFSINITGGRKFGEINLSYLLVVTGAPAKIFKIKAEATNSKGIKKDALSEVIVYENKPCSVNIYIVSPQETPISPPPFPVQLGAAVTDDKCGNFTAAQGTTCNFKFIWDADNQGGDFTPDGETNQPSFTFTYNSFGIYTPKVKVIDDGGNECESQNFVPVYVARRIEKINPLFFSNIFPSIQSFQLNDKIKVFSSQVDFGVSEYTINKSQPELILESTKKIGETNIGVDFGKYDSTPAIFYKTPGKIYVFPISDRVNWGNKITEINLTYEEMRFLSFENKVTFIATFTGDVFSACPLMPSAGFLGEVCLRYSLKYRFSSPYSFFIDGDNLLVAHYVSGYLKVVVYSFSLKFSSSYGIYILEGPNETYEVDVAYPSSHIEFFKENGKIYIAISSADINFSVAYRTYILDFSSCRTGNCSFVQRTNISMESVISNIARTEICPTSEPSEFRANILDFLIPSDFAFCGNLKCILSLLCLDDITRGRKCAKNAVYPFIFSGGEVLKNLNTNCVETEPQSNIVYAWGTTAVLSSKAFLSLYDFSAKTSSKILDIDSLFLEPESLSGYEKEGNFYVSLGGAGGVNILKFNFDGNLSDLVSHIYVRPEGKFADNTYSVKEHYLDDNILVAVLEKPGCGEEWIFSGIIIYDMKNSDLLKRRKYKVYIPYSQIDIHSVSNLFVIKDSAFKYRMIVSGTKCQTTEYTTITYEIDISDFSVREIGRIKFGESPLSFEGIPGGEIFISSPKKIFLIDGNQVKKELDEEGGGILRFYKGLLYEVGSRGNYISIKVFDTNLVKKDEFSFYVGVYPSVSSVKIASAFDEFFGTGDIDLIFAGLSIPQIYSKVSALMVFDATEYIKFGRPIRFLGVVPAQFDIGAVDILFFRGSKNMIFLLDFSKVLFRIFLK